MLYAAVGMFGMVGYHYSLFHVYMHLADPGSIVMDRLKNIGSMTGTLGCTLTVLEICVVWITLVLAAKKTAEGGRIIKSMVGYVWFIRGECGEGG